MNYAKKELHEAIAYLEKARTQENELTKILRAFILGEPVEVTFRTATATATALAPSKQGKKLLEQLLDKAQGNIMHLEKQEVYWCGLVTEEAEIERISDKGYFAEMAKAFGVNDSSEPTPAT
ncbi:hypothetical protein E5K00_06025 [Hymenobacter aquaticus]|uniref:Uncharacterized protein n=1 Tax=Hymenobacter aquaticus TaxID=1867101 RepID=A0A4Z0Q7S4_9BACT|nr:hypothetical protein [Hymenobacter aquaticus]TGE24762.1 hypothetical protein E5K00_06025 [Hymenobacter aquaticus]